MRLLISYPKTQNHGFNFVYNNIATQLKAKYPQFDIQTYDCAEVVNLVQHSAYCGGCNLSIINLDTKKCVILSFADIAQIHAFAGHGFDEFKIMEIYGGLAWGESQATPQEISDRWQIRYVPFQYPLPYDDFEEYLQTNRTPYNPSSKIRKAIFLGMQHTERRHVLEHLQHHPLFEIPANYYSRHEYWSEMNKYAMILSLNGNGEFCVRDIEGYALGIPTVRSELKAQTRYHPVVPDVHYIRGSEPSNSSRMTYKDSSLLSYKQIAEQFVDAVETSMYNDELLINISNNGLQYYENYCKFNYISDLFVELFNPEALL